MKTRLPILVRLFLVLFSLILIFPKNIYAVAPVISDVTLSNITSTSVTFTWTTDIESDSAVGYATDPGFNTEIRSTDTTFTTSHSITITSLTPDTSYYYYVESNSGSGAASYSNVFNTASVATAAPTPTPVTVTVTVTATSTATATPTPTPTPTPFVDRIAPAISISSDLSGIFEKAPTIEGTATDSIAVSSVDYSIDNGENWLPVDNATGLGGKSVDFSFTPQFSEDGNYEVLIRAIDPTKNIGTSGAQTLIIDRLPPRVGGNVLSLGPIPLLPNKDGFIVTIPGLEQRITMSAVGGPTSIDLLVNNQMSSLEYSAQINLWSGTINLSNPGLYQLKTKAIDGAGNKTERDLNPIIVVEPGKVRDSDSNNLVDEGEITVYVRDSLTSFWSKWDGDTFGQENPQDLQDGSYQFFLPPGTYYLTIKAPGNPRLTSKIFKIDKARPLNADFRMQPRKLFKIGPISIPLPDMFSDKTSIIIKEPNTKGMMAETLIGENYPSFDLPSTDGEFNSNQLRGDRAIITFINTWSPSAAEQLPILDDYYQEKKISHAVVASQETKSKILVFQKKGKYESEIVIDQDGELVEDYHLTSLPKHYFIDRRGIIKDIVTGVLNKEELDGKLSEL